MEAWKSQEMRPYVVGIFVYLISPNNDFYRIENYVENGQ